jgi:hypothetical protein
MSFNGHPCEAGFNSDHQRILYQCGHLKTQCGCVGDKRTVIAKESCPVCEKLGIDVTRMILSAGEHRFAWQPETQWWICTHCDYVPQRIPLRMLNNMREL